MMFHLHYCSSKCIVGLEQGFILATADPRVRPGFRKQDKRLNRLVN